MKEFMLLFRQPVSVASQMSPKEFAAVARKWKIWVDDLIAQDKIVSGHRLATEGKVLKSNEVITDGPFVEVKERLGGLIVVRAGNLEEATTLAQGCPVLTIQGSVEIRAIMV